MLNITLETHPETMRFNGTAVVDGIRISYGFSESSPGRPPVVTFEEIVPKLDK